MTSPGPPRRSQPSRKPPDPAARTPRDPGAPGALGDPGAREEARAPRPEEGTGGRGDLRRGRSAAGLRRDDGRLVRGRRSRARIRAAAAALFREKGFDGATLRAIAARAGMGASSIYRHVRSKEELLVAELADRQEEAWQRFRARDRREAPTRGRIGDFLDAWHELLAEDPDLVTVALRATTHPGARAARQVLAVHDRTIGLLAEILQQGRIRGELGRDVDILASARTLFHIVHSARIPWANGQIDAETCRTATLHSVDLLFQGLSPTPRHGGRKRGRS